MLVFPSSAPQRPRSFADVNALVSYCLDGKRPVPLLLASLPKGATEPAIDVDALVKATTGLMDVAIIADAGLIRYAGELFLRRGCPDLTPYNGAVRLFPVPTTDVMTASDTELHYTDTVRHRRKLADAIADVLRLTPFDTRVQAIVDAICHDHDESPLDMFRRMHTIIRTTDEADSLADLLLSGNRHLPVVVISHISRQRPPFVDIDLLSDLLHDIAPIVEITSRKATEALCDRIAKPAWLYGEAGRVYPAGTAWNSPDAKMRLFLPNVHVSRMLMTNMMASEALLRHADTIRGTSGNRLRHDA